MGQHRYQYDYQTDQLSGFVLVPITITLGVNDRVPFNETSGSGPTFGVIAPGVYATGAALAAAVAAACTAAGDSSFQCIFSSGTHKLTLSKISDTFTLDWASRPTNSAATALGWNVADVAVTASSTAQNAITL